jgi:outer membrane murein-binding lipoprotein Lpp
MTLLCQAVPLVRSRTYLQGLLAAAVISLILGGCNTGETEIDKLQKFQKLKEEAREEDRKLVEITKQRDAQRMKCLAAENEMMRRFAELSADDIERWAFSGKSAKGLPTAVEEIEHRHQQLCRELEPELQALNARAEAQNKLSWETRQARDLAEEAYSGKPKRKR